MGLRQLINALLPTAYREQVLGDLHERGFRPRDIVNVVPRIWWSHLTRFPTPVPEDLELRRSLERHEARRRWFVLFYAVALAVTMPYNPGMRTFTLWVLGFFAILLPASFIFPSQARKLERGALLQHLRRVLEGERAISPFGLPYILLCFRLADPVKALWGDGARLLFCLAAAAACVAYGRRRASHLQKEINSLT